MQEYIGKEVGLICSLEIPQSERREHGASSLCFNQKDHCYVLCLLAIASKDLTKLVKSVVRLGSIRTERTLKFAINKFFHFKKHA